MHQKRSVRVTVAHRIAQRLELSRRELLRLAGGAAAAAALQPLGLLRHTGAAPALGRAAGGPNLEQQQCPALSQQIQLPFWSDGKWDQPEYYETIRLADIDGDGRAELLGRGPGGIQSNHWDTQALQWRPLPPGPELSDAGGWDRPQYYETIRLDDINLDGQAELIARAADGIHTFQYDYLQQQWHELGGPEGQPAFRDGTGGWDQPQYYETIRLADIDGDHQAELIARDANGIITYHWVGFLSTWRLISTGPGLSDAGGWDRPQYYETIRLADIDGDGQAELIARAADGIHTWKFDRDQSQWGNYGQAGPPLADGPPGNWDGREHFSTIQLADINGDRQAELIARSPDGIIAYRWDKGSTSWTALPAGPALSDAGGWNQPQYYSTIQVADIDGDGRAELLARAADGLHIWKFTEAQQWEEQPLGPDWSDSASWNLVQHYSTIRAADIDGDGRAELLARDAASMETWKFDPDTKQWSRPTAQFPQFTGSQLAAYQYLNRTLPFVDPNTDLRAQYSTVASSVLTTWQATLLGGDLKPPQNVSQADWTAVTTQIEKEISLVLNVIGLFGLTQQLFTDLFIVNDDLLDVTAARLEADQSDDSTAVTAVQAITNALWALSALVSLVATPAVAAAAAVVTGLMAAGSTLLSLTTGAGTAFVGTYLAIKEQLVSTFTNFLCAHANTQEAVIGDYGLLQAQGSQVKWSDVVTAQLLEVGTTAYEAYLWSILTPLVWIAERSCTPPVDYPLQYSLTVNANCGFDNRNSTIYWLRTQSSQLQYPSTDDLQHLFETLQVPLQDVLFGLDGWSLPVATNIPFPSAANAGQPTPDSHPPLEVFAVEVDAQVSHHHRRGIVVTVTLTNGGAARLSNVELLSARLGDLRRLTSLPGRRHVLAQGRSKKERIRFRPWAWSGRDEVPLELEIAHAQATLRKTVLVTLP